MDYRASEKLLECPFEPVHRILPHRMAAHIAKCWKNHRDADVKVCPFNATHIIKTHLFQAHLLECPDRVIVERDAYLSQKIHSQLQEKKTEVVKVPQIPVGVQEDWDSEMVVSSYKPADHIIHREFARPPPPGMGKAARRKWREREIQRVQCLKEGRPIDHLMNPDAEISDSQEENSNRILYENFNSTKSALLTENSIMQCHKKLRKPRIAANIGLNIKSCNEDSS